MKKAKPSDSETDGAEPVREVPTNAPLGAPTSGRTRRLGAMQGQFTVPDDFDSFGSAEIERLF